MRYICYHVPTRTEHIRTIEDVNELTLLRLIDGWNRLGSGVYIYYRL